jgi:hypothetical protein
MSVNIPSHYITQYANNIQMLLQQQGSRLRQAVTVGSYKGEQASPVDQVGAIEMQPVVTRFGAMGRVDAAVDRRWVAPSDFELPQLIDSFDKLRMLTDPNSIWVQNAVAAAGRQYDRLILAAAIGTNKTGKSGTTSTVLPSAQKVAVSFGAASDTGLTVAKLREAKRLLMAADVNLESDPLYCAIGAAQHDNLLAEAQVISSDFNGGNPVLVEGKLVRFLGINFIHTELSNATAQLSSGDALIAMWAKSGMHLGIWNDTETSISKRNDLSGEPWQAYVKMSAGSTRLEEEKIVQIACNI